MPPQWWLRMTTPARLAALIYSTLVAVLSVACGGIFLPPPVPDKRPVCIQNLQGEFINCDCWRLKGAFTWKHYEWRACVVKE